MIIPLILFLLLDGALYAAAASIAGIGPVLILGLATTLGGIVLLRIQTGPSLARLMATLRNGGHLDRAILMVARVLIGGILLIMPGLLTDIFGFLIVLPVIGPAVCRAMVPVLRSIVARPGARAATDPTVIDADSRTLTEDPTEPGPPRPIA